MTLGDAKALTAPFESFDLLVCEGCVFCAVYKYTLCDVQKVLSLTNKMVLIEKHVIM